MTEFRIRHFPELDARNADFRDWRDSHYDLPVCHCGAAAGYKIFVRGNSFVSCIIYVGAVCFQRAELPCQNAETRLSTQNALCLINGSVKFLIF